MKTTYNVYKFSGEKLGDNVTLSRAEFIKEYYLDEGNMGVNTGKGFYKYTNPRHSDPDFLK